MGNAQENKYNQFIDFSVKLEKLCYFPGEDINGTLYIMGKPGLLETQLKEPKVSFKIYEKLKTIPTQSGTIILSSTEELSKKAENEFMFNTFIDPNLLTGVNIPFNFKIPSLINPSCYFVINSFAELLQHFFSVELPSLKVKRTICIVIKNNPNFTSENKLLQIPCTFSKTKSKSTLFKKKGNFNITINLKKNSFYYDELIPFEIFLDSKNLKISIKKIKISIERALKKDLKKGITHTKSSKTEDIITISQDLDKNSNEHEIKDSLIFPQNDDHKYSCPTFFYESVEKEEFFFQKPQMMTLDIKKIKLKK